MIEKAVDRESPFKELNIKIRRTMGGGGTVEEEGGRWPPWQRPLLSTNFFVQCKYHADSHRNECNMYCLDCMSGALCSSVSTATAATTRFRSILSSACLLSIRRSSYHDVIRVSEIQKVLDLTGVQTYIINSARVVFLNERPQPRPRKGVTNNCEVCGRSLLDSFRFCSLGCKMAGTAPDRKRKNKILHEAMKIKSTTESDTDESYTSISRGSEKSNVTHSPIPSTPPPTAASLSSAKRRKGIPHRAPFGSLTLEF